MEALNAGLAEPDPSLNLATPQAVLEYLLRTGRSEDFQQAAHALNLNLIPASEQAQRAPRLARKLLYLLENRLVIDWDRVPDRPDGRIDKRLMSSAGLGGSDAVAGGSRRSIRLGSLALGEREVPIRLQRIKPAGADPRWMISAQTVENLPALYGEHGPGWPERTLPERWRTEFAGEALADWLIAALALPVIALSAWLLLWVSRIAIQRMSESWPRTILAAVRRPALLLLAAWALQGLNRALSPLSESAATVLDRGLSLLLFGAAIWLMVRIGTAVIDHAERQVSARRARRESGVRMPVLTWLAVARRVFVFLLVVVGVGLALWQLPDFRSVGVSLLASAGVLSVLIGVAANAFIANLIGSIQIGLTRPVEIGDNVRFEGQWGYVEDIAYTYLVLRTWDERRWVIPLQYFLSRPVENLTRSNRATVMSVYLYVDYRIDVQGLREHYEQLLRNDPDWDGTIQPYLLVTEAKGETVELRAVCSAADPVKSFFLSCRLREALLAYLRELEGGRYLPRMRVEPIDWPDEAVLGAEAQHRGRQADAAKAGSAIA